MGSKLYVGNLSYDVSEGDLRDLFAQDGRNVADVAVIMDRETGRSRGFAFVTMGSDADAKAAMGALDGQAFQGRNLKVNEAQDRGGGGGGRGGPRGGGGGFGGGRDRGGRGDRGGGRY